MCSLYVGNVVPLLKKVLKELNYSSLTDIVDALNSLHKFLRENCPDFAEACSTAVKEGVIQGIKFLQRVLKKIVELCKQNKELITYLSKLAAKSVVRECAVTLGTKYVIKYGAGKVASQSVKTALKLTNPAGMVADAAQLGLEITGHKEISKKVGLWGNIGTGAVAGGVIGGPVGAPIGALVGLGTWLIGEAVGQAVEERLS